MIDRGVWWRCAADGRGRRAFPRGSRRRSAAALLLAIGMALGAPLHAQASRAPTRHAGPQTIPAGLARAIHARLGPGPLRLGSTPPASQLMPAAGGGWEARFRSLSLSTHITSGGTASARLGASGSVSLTPLSISSGAARAPLSVKQSSLGGGRLIQRLGAATITYQVTAAGLEQRFTIGGPPARGSQLVLRLGSNVRWRSTRAGSAIVPSGVRAGRLAYAGLRATDARGRPLPAHFTVAPGGSEIVLDTKGAVYPITIDPTWTTSSSPTATLTNGAEDGVGDAVSVSSDGTTALVGAYGANDDQGIAYIFHVSSEGSWTSSSLPTAALTVGTGKAHDDFGWSVALSSDGTTALIGAIGQADGGVGAAYVFHVAAEGSWTSSSTPTATLTNGSGTSGDAFGGSIALSSDGTTALISGCHGAACVFQTSTESSWASSSTPTATLTDPSGGGRVALSSDGTTALIGNGSANTYTGAAYVFHVATEQSWTTTATPTATLTNGAGGQYDYFASSIALSPDGTTALIGSRAVNNLTGAAFVFHVSGEGSWTSSSTPTATLSSGVAYSQFGISVALSSDGTTALIGAWYPGYKGSAYVFHVSAESSWVSSSSPAATLTNGSGAPSDGFGAVVALSPDGTTAFVGADGFDDGAGAVFVFHSSTAASWASSSSPTATLDNGPGYEGDQMGYSVALSADGTTALVGANQTGVYLGSVYVFHVSAEGSWNTNSTPTATLSNGCDPSSGGCSFGSSVALSADGTTALIGASSNDGGNGAAYIFHVSSEDAWSSTSTPTATLTNGSDGGEFGNAVALSSDGTIALVGAYLVSPYDSGTASYTVWAGAAYVFHASSEASWASSSTPTATLTNGTGTEYQIFGDSLALSQDGTTALIGADGEGNYEVPSAGAAYVFHVSAEGSWASNSTPTATLADSTDSSSDYLGYAVAMSSDGTTALVGAPGVSSRTGAAYVFKASAESSWSSSSSPTATLANSSDSAGNVFGDSVALSSDGTTALVGAPAGGSTGAGAAYLFQSSAEDSWTSSSTPAATLSNALGGPGNNLGDSVSLSSDGDAALVGADGVDVNEGAADVYVASSSPTYTLTVSPAGSGSGTVTSTDGDIDCGGTCSYAYAPSTTVTLNATPATGSTFAGWSGGGCSGTGSCVVTMSSTQDVTAAFTANTPPPQQTLTVSLAGTGAGGVTSSPAGITCPGNCSTNFNQGTMVTLTAAAASGSTFAGWSGAGCSGTGTCAVTMNSAQAATATFTANSSSTSPPPGTTTGGGTPPPPKPSCALMPQGSTVYAAPKHTKKHKKKHPPYGVLTLAVRCDQPTSLTLTGKITATIRVKHKGKKRSETKAFALTAISANATTDHTITLTVTLPNPALTALKAGARETAQFTLTTTNPNGTATTTATTSQLKLVRK